MRTIWKFPLRMEGLDRSDWIIEVSMPKGADILTVAVQYNIPTLWAMVDPDAEYELRRFFVAATGERLPDYPLTYLGSLQTEKWQGQEVYVWHIFEVGTPARDVAVAMQQIERAGVVIDMAMRAARVHGAA